MDLRARVIELNTIRMGVIEQGDALLESLKGREMSGEERQTWNRLNERVDEIDAEVRSLVQRETRESEAAALRAAAESTFGEHRVETRQVSENDQLRNWLLGDANYRRNNPIEVNIEAARRERELLRSGAGAAELRALAWDTGSVASGVPTTMARTLYENMEAFTVMMRAPTYKFTTASGEQMKFPKVNAHAIATQVSGQGTTLAGTDPTFDRVALNVTKYGELVKIANELVTDSAFDIASWIGQDLGYALARVVDADLITGTGTGEATGMTVLAGAGTNAPVTTGGSLIAPTVEKFIDLQYSVNDAYRERGAAWLMKDSVAGTIRKLRDGAGGTVGAFLWEPSLTNGIQGGQPDRFLGAPVYTDGNCAAAGSNAKLATYGDFSQYIIRTVGNPTIERSDEAGFATDEAFFRGKWRVGGNHRAVGGLNNLVQNV